MVHKTDSTQSTLTIVREFHAPRALVFAAWTDPKHLAQWWGPHGFTTPVCEADARPGGRLHIDMRSPDGTLYPCLGTFEEVVAPERVVFVTSALGENGRSLFDVRTTATFEERGGKTRVTLQANVLATYVPEAAQYLDGMEAGWTQSLERLEAYVSSM